MGMSETPPTASDPSAASARSRGLGTAGQKTAIILLNWNGWADTIACLESLMTLDNADFGVFVCDNGSRDESVAQIRAWASQRLGVAGAPSSQRLTGFLEYEANGARSYDAHWPPASGTLGRVVLIQTGGNFGFAGGNNVGLRFALAAEYDYFWLLNNDTEVEPDTLTHMLARMAEDRNIGICGSTLVYAATPDVVQCLCGATFSHFKGKGVALGAGQKLSDPIDRAEIETKMRYVNGASMLVSRAFLERIGLMAEDYFLYYEELDWAARARRQFTLGYAPQSLVRHKVGATIGTSDLGSNSDSASSVSVYYLERNRFWYCWRHAKLALPFVVFDTARLILRHCLARRWSRAWLVLCAAFSLPFPR